MAKADYDHFAGLGRLVKAAATVDQRAAVILTYHAALEREVDVVLGRLLPRGDRLPRRLGFGHKIEVLAAAWRGAEVAGDRLYNVLFRFNELRNAVAHGDRIDLVEDSLERLLGTYRLMIPDAVTEGIEIAEVAAGICGFMADGPTPRELVGSFKGLKDIVEQLDGASPAPSGSRGSTPTN
ncbi:MAG TPA: hypothetical protein VF655_04005 [Allosphingosinicella sp.]|jgi:hypothetical protein